jgi:hypothetical protein
MQLWVLGFKYASFGLDLSILFNTSKINTALDNTLRFGLTWNIGSETYNAQIINNLFINYNSKMPLFLKRCDVVIISQHYL